MKGKRILSAVLSAALLLQLSPLAVFAEDTSLLPVTAQTALTEPAPEEPTPEPAGEETALPEEPAPEETAVPMAAPTPEPAAEPTAAPAPEETAAPDAAETPAPEPSAEPTAAPDPAAAVQAMIDALPDEVTEDNAAAVEQALTDVDDAKQSLTDDELAGLDFSRYDAAANALLALWGEAPADEVELLDNYPTPTTEGEWYVIDSVDDLYWLATAPKNVKAKLTADITVNPGVLDDDGNLISNPNLTSWKPIGTSYNSSFKGTFDGGGHTISGLYFNDSNKNYVGLFGYVGEGGTVKNVTITDSYVSGSRCVGGICGNNNGIVQDCTSGCTVKGTDDFTGGICGFNNFGSLKNCHNTGKVSGNTDVGGVCGWNEYGILQESYNTGEVSGNTYVGGVCGQNHGGTVKRCYNTVEVSGESNVGGVCGCNDRGTVQESYNTGEVFGNNNFVGGVCGQNQGNVKGCYNTGKVSGKSKVGGVCGGTSSTGCYYLDTSGTDSKGGISKTLAEFQSGEVAYLLQKALDDAATAANKPTTQVWGQMIGTDNYPVLSSEPGYKVYHPDSGTHPCNGGYSNSADGALEHQYVDRKCIYCGEHEPPNKAADGFYEIYDQWQLRWFADQVNNQNRPNINARLMNDITMDGTEWTPIGTSNEHPFTGDFDGNGKTITGLKCTKPNVYDVGLVGYASKATIQNVTVKDSSFIGNERIGAVCGSIIDGKITGCTNSGSTVSGGFYNLGGIAGRAENTPVQRCFNSGAVTGKYSAIGGIVGYADYVTVQDCGNTGTVTMTDSAGAYYGGIIGAVFGYSTIENCYNTDSNTTAGIYAGMSRCDLSNCYYLPNDTGSSGSTGTDIIAKTQAQFNSGEVAYLLQNGREQAVWGQKIDTDDYPKLGGDKVYQSAPCTADYGNTEIPPKQHVIGNDGKCTNCGAQCIAYTVTIPATVELGNKATITATGVTLPNDKQLNVKVADDSVFNVSLSDGTNVVDTQTYTVTKEDKTEVTRGSTVLTAEDGDTDKQTSLTFNTPASTTYSGEYKGTVTFTVSVDNKAS